MAQKNSRNFSFVGHNIKKIRQAKNISQSDFAALFSLARPSVGAYEEGRSEPKIETLIQISRYFDISIDVMLTRQLSSKDIYSLGLLNKKLDKAHAIDAKQPAIQTVPFVGINEKVNYLVNRLNKEYLNNLPRLGLPESHLKIDLVLENEGAYLEVDNKGIRHGDLLFCKKYDIGKLARGLLVALVREEGILVGRVHEEGNERVRLTFDNTLYDSVSLKKESILACYLVAACYTTHLQRPSSLEDRLKAIEDKLTKM